MEIKTKKRVRRTPINGTRGVLNVKGKDSNFEYRIVNDEGDRIDTFVGNGWEVVKDDSVSIGERRVKDPSQEGSVVSASVGSGVRGILMRIKKEWYDEDQTAKKEAIDELELDMKREIQKEGFYGKLEIKRN